MDHSGFLLGENIVLMQGHTIVLNCDTLIKWDHFVRASKTIIKLDPLVQARKLSSSKWTLGLSQ